LLAVVRSEGSDRHVRVRARAGLPLILTATASASLDGNVLRREQDGIADIGFARAAWIIDPSRNVLGIIQPKGPGQPPDR
jgi:hypothetical protein